MVREREVIDAVELHLLNQWHLRNARARRRQRERQRRLADQQRLAMLYWLASALMLGLSAVILWGWG